MASPDWNEPNIAQRANNVMEPLETESKNKYKQFRNYMCNELGITRQDIEAWTKQAAANEIERKIQNLNIDKMVRESIDKVVHVTVNGGHYGNAQQLREAIAKEVAQQLVLSIKS